MSNRLGKLKKKSSTKRVGVDEEAIQNNATYTDDPFATTLEQDNIVQEDLVIEDTKKQEGGIDETANEVSADSVSTSKIFSDSTNSNKPQEEGKGEETKDEPKVNIEEATETLTIEPEESPPNLIPEVGIVEKSEPVKMTDTDLFQKISRTSVASQLGGLAGQIEATVSAQCQLSGVRNLDLNSFGIRAYSLEYANLSVITYGKHFFLGIPFTEKEKNLIVHKIALYVNSSHKQELTLSAVQLIKDEHGMNYYSLLIDDDIAQTLADNFNYKVYTNPNESDISKLVIHIKKSK